MLSKSILKYIQSLHHKKQRDEQNEFLAETPKVIGDLLKHGKFTCKMICGTAHFFNNYAGGNDERHPPGKIVVTETELEKISLLQSPNEALAIFAKGGEQAVDPTGKVTLLLDDIRDPGNLGTIVRICDWFGIASIVCSNNCVDIYNPKVVQSSMGSIGNVNVVYLNLDNFIRANNTVRVYAAALNGEPVYDLKNIEEAMLVIGNESIGISDAILNERVHKITIPRIGNAESLNAAVATGIIVAQFRSAGIKVQ